MTPLHATLNEALEGLRARAKAQGLTGSMGVVVVVHFRRGEESALETMECAAPKKESLR